MRTKTLLLTAALSAAGLATSMAQTVYSVNIVGYVNLTIPKGFSIIANPLVAPTNTVAQLFASPPDDTTIYKFNNATAGYAINSFIGGWDNPGMTLVPGEGAFVFVPGTASITNTFVGEVMTGNLTNNVPRGFSIVSSQVPQAGTLQTDLKFTPQDDDTIYQFNNATGGYKISEYIGGWEAEPTVRVGEGFFIRRPAAKAWTRTFNVGS